MAAAPPSLERFFLSPEGGGVPTASNLQRAICRAARGEPLGDLLDEAELTRHFGVTSIRAGVLPTLVVLICGIRSGKSFLAAAAAIHAALTAHLSMLKPHELPRYAIIAPKVDVATATFQILVGMLTSSPRLARFIEGEPTGDTIVLRRPDGRRVEIVVVAANQGGLSVRNRWLVGFCLEEVAQFGTELQGRRVNAEDLLRAAETRLLPGCQGWLISSPYGPEGLLYELYTRHFGKPGDRLVVHAPTTAMNPAFPPERVRAIRAQDPDTAAREYDAAWLDADQALVHYGKLALCVRPNRLVVGPQAGRHYVAAIDPATRGNAWTLVVATREGDLYRVVLVHEWIGSKTAPLIPKRITAEMARMLRPYGVAFVSSDRWAADKIREAAIEAGLYIDVQPATTLHYTSMAALIVDQRVELPPHAQLLEDLKLVRKRTDGTSLRIVLPRSRNGRHCDFAPALALALAQPIPDADRVTPEDDDVQYQRYLAACRREAGDGFES